MLCPKYNFKPPPHKFFIEKYDFRKRSVPMPMKTHYFNHSISVVLPDTVTVPTRLQNCLLIDTNYYQVNGLRACDLLYREFIEAFVKKGEVNLLTVGVKIDLESSICLTPSGHLVLSLIDAHYQALGLEGRVSFFASKSRTRYVVVIDLNDENFIPGNKNFERVRIALKKRLSQNFNVIVSWHPSQYNVCPSSIAAWFEKLDYTVDLASQRFSQRTEYSLMIPTLQDECNIDKFFEWLGIFSTDCKLSNGETDDANPYKCPSPSIQVGQVQYLKYTGFFTSRKMQEIYNVLKDYILSRNTVSWISLDVQGFADSPISWGLREHTFFTDGDNSYTIIFQPNDESIIRQSSSSNNRPRTNSE
ncbi:ribonuclease P protein subunit p40-like isoform X1 [Linepithema humile]|uniref:ribonuclease P protein subunit p40-like isoform X1 n=1 Tax=Linepithema humile TaxID=83485 RepID=UPI0006235B6D|nr:PREDICTED: ribonuclease P protein subunit p40-like [Linepithema humile]